jgi:hypothetical protein
MRRASSENRRKFAAELLEHAFFGAFYSVISARKKEQSLTRAQLGKRMGREKTGISKLLSGPRNWQISTISDLAEALDVRVEFRLVDRINPLRTFTPTGVTFNIPNQMSGPFQMTNADLNRATGVFWGSLLPVSQHQYAPLQTSAPYQLAFRKTNMPFPQIPLQTTNMLQGQTTLMQTKSPHEQVILGASASPDIELASQTSNKAEDFMRTLREAREVFEREYLLHQIDRTGSGLDVGQNDRF